MPHIPRIPSAEKIRLLIEERVLIDDIPAGKDEPSDPAGEDYRRKITPLQRFLSLVPSDELFDFLQSMNVRWTFRRASERNYQMTIWSEGGYKCFGRGETPKGALTNAVAKFFCSETRDYHEL